MVGDHMGIPRTVVFFALSCHFGRFQYELAPSNFGGQPTGRVVFLFRARGIILCRTIDQW
jgi:hypothetical protein